MIGSDGMGRRRTTGVGSNETQGRSADIDGSLGHDGQRGLGRRLWMLVVMLVVAVVVLVGVWLIVRSSRDGRSSRPDALDILRERFARGEITKDEFETARKTVGS
jgi:putative membrane protein